MLNAHPPAGHVTVDFLDLPSIAREAFTRAIIEKRAPIEKRTGGDWVLVAVAGVVVLGLVSLVGFGDAGGDSPIGRTLALGAYALGFAALAMAVSMYRRDKTWKQVLGCSPGIYALGTQLVDARSRRLRVYELAAADPAIVHHYVNGGYRNTSLSWHGILLQAGARDMPDRVLATVNWQWRVLREASRTGDGALMLAIDPIAVGLAIMNSVGPARTSPPLASVRRPLALAAAATLALSVGAWALRDYASTEVAFARIRSASEADLWIQGGGDPARGLQKKMEVDLTRTAIDQVGNARQLREALARYPDAPAELAQPVEAALARRYELARAAALGLSASEPLTAFINQIYDRLETKGVAPAMHVEATRTDTSALTAFDDGVAAEPKSSPRLVRVARYFDAADDATRTQAVKRAVQAGLGQFFPDDVMVFSDEPDATQAKVTIFYVIRMKASAVGGVTIYQAVDAHHVPVAGAPEYPGVELELGATLQVPGAAQPQRVTFIARPAPSITVETGDASAAASAATNAEVYRAMADSAFADLQQKLVRALGGKPDVDETIAEPPAAGCADLDRELAQLQACASVARGDRAKLSAELGKLAATGLDSTTFCTRATALVHRSFARAKCPAPPPAAATGR